MTLSYFKQILSEDTFSVITELIEKKVVSENQFVQIIINTFGANEKHGHIQNRIYVLKTLIILNFISDLNDKYPNDKYLNNSIKRLMSNNGFETANELYTHIALFKSFSNYSVTYPLYVDAPDGYINDTEGNIPVEIKSRFPEVFKLIKSFQDKISSVIKIVSKKDIFIELHIIKLKKLDLKIVNSEVNHFIQLSNSNDFTKIPNLPYVYSFKRSTENITYAISLFSKPSEKGVTGITSRQDKNAIYIHNIFKMDKDRFPSSKNSSVHVSNEVKAFLGKKVVDSCIKGIKNLPKEPRVIAIYSDHFMDSILQKFFKKVIDNYVKRKQGSCVVLISGYFNERDEGSLSINSISAGKGILSVIERNFSRPEFINN